MKIAIIGTGYVGLVSGTCFSEMGNDVVCVDIDAQKIESLNHGDVPIYEPGLDLLIERNFRIGRLKFTTDLNSAVDYAEIILLALPTPPGEDGSADLSYVLNMAETLGGLIKKYTLVVNKSTVPVGTAEQVSKTLAKNLDRKMFDVVSNPEFLREGGAVQDFLKPDRVVIGCPNDKSFEVMQRLYKPFMRQGNPIIRMDVRSAELTKYASNSYLATRISFMNEIANLCDKLGANVDYVRRGMGADSRIGKRFLFPGIGYGGSCFPKDVSALKRTSEDSGYDFQILQSVMKVNDLQKGILFDRIAHFFNGDLKGKKVTVWGLAFKPETDDIREAPSLVLINKLLQVGAEVSVFDPEAMSNVKSLYGDQLKYASDPYDALEGAEVLAICTEWSIFRTLDIERLISTMENPVIFDGRNVFDHIEMNNKGIQYFSIGRP